MGTACRRNRGYSLIEVLIAFFVLSVGLMGIAALHLGSLRDNGSAALRTRAIVLAADMFDRIRANGSALEGNLYSAATGSYGTDNGCFSTATTVAAPCTPAEMAAHDIYQWKRLIADVDDTGINPPTGLPEGTASITVTTVSATLRTVTITLQWIEGEDTMSYTASTQIWI